MPRAPRKCPREGCTNRITSTRYCPEHTTWHWSPNSSRDAAHRAWAKAVKIRDKYMCQINGPDCLTRGTIADHIIPVAEGGKDTLPNGRCVCENCDREKVRAEATRGIRRANGNDTPEEPAPF